MVNVKWLMVEMGDSSGLPMPTQSIGEKISDEILSMFVKKTWFIKDKEL